MTALDNSPALMSEMGKAMMGSATVSGENRAVEAARQAISSPLLEDINLHGAKGLLVNITAGPDMAIGEFEAVGNAVHEYAAADANVVIGTAFDPEMEGDLRVTMVATGLSDPKAAKAAPEQPIKAAPPPPEEKKTEPLPKGAMVPPRRFGRGGGAATAAAPAEAAQLDLDHLDIPAFLRRQAD